ncbi:MAG: endonuclease MutS2 [Cyclobacteriaceae bacterium]
MKYYPQNIETKLGFDKIKAELTSMCLSPLGTKYVDVLSPQYKLLPIQKLLKQTAEFIRIVSSGEPFPQNNYIDIRAGLKKSEVPGAFLEEEELFDIKLSVSTILGILDFLKSQSDEYPELFALAERIELDSSLAMELEAKIDDKGELRDNASRHLMDIRERIAKGQVRARTAVNKVMKQAGSSGYCPDGASITVRDGRMVIPVLAEHKRHIKGFVHDESSTGQTVYMEPAEALEINNELRELKYAERREIIRILTELTDHVRDQLVTLETAIHFLGIIDFIRAKACFAIKYEGICPAISAKPVLNWVNARHPVLEMALKEQGKKIIPLNIHINQEQRILLISGPNAGGKSVCLKTIGILQYMVQCGLPVPVAENSEFGIFSSLFMDIGDEQSIENDLSTYSSHLKNMKFFLENTGKETLFLIDEFGTGTEPQFGGAIAEVILHELNRKRAFGAITTHYGNLKKAADKLPGVVNGAMKYDVKKLEPLYSLEIGNPGSSFALEIAGKIGLNKEMLGRAKKIAGVSHVQFDRLINELEVEKSEIKKMRKDVEQKDRRLSEAIKDYEELKAFVEEEKPKIIQEAKSEAARIIRESNRQVEQTIRDIKKSDADKIKTREARDKLKAFEGKVGSAKDMPKPPTSPAPEEVVLSVGDKVRIKNGDAVAEITAIKGKKAELVMGSIKSRANLKDLSKISSKEFKNISNEKVKKIAGIDVNAKMTSFSPNLDIRGVRAEEAMVKVETFLDEALLLGYDEIKVLHGKGHGILRDIVRNTLRGNNRVGAMRDEHIEFGGSGITVVELK